MSEIHFLAVILEIPPGEKHCPDTSGDKHHPETNTVKRSNSKKCNYGHIKKYISMKLCICNEHWGMHEICNDFWGFYSRFMQGVGTSGHTDQNEEKKIELKI